MKFMLNDFYLFVKTFLRMPETLACVCTKHREGFPSRCFVSLIFYFALLQKQISNMVLFLLNVLSDIQGDRYHDYDTLYDVLVVGIDSQELHRRFQ